MYLEKKRKYLLDYLIIILSILLVFLIIWVGVSISNKIKEGRYIGQDIKSVNTISVSGKAEIYAKPDLALITVSVTNEAKTVSEAIRENTKKMNAVIDFIKNKGVEEKDLKTVGFNIYPRYEWRNKVICTIPPCPSGKRVLVGYEVNQSLQVKIRDMEKVGSIIEGAIKAGANDIDDLRFVIDKREELKKQARDKAIEDAKNKAKELASKLGVRLIRIKSFSQSRSLSTPNYWSSKAMSMEETGGEGEVVPQIKSGENKITANVTIVYEID